MNCVKCGKLFDSTSGSLDGICEQCRNSPKEFIGGIHGWICPVCGAGLSPYTQRCSCQGYPPMKVTC